MIAFVNTKAIFFCVKAPFSSFFIEWLYFISDN